MTKFKLFRNWMAFLLVITVLTNCHKKEIENDPVPGSEMRIAEVVTCTNTISASQSIVDGSNIPAGSVVCLPAGTRGALLLKNFQGTATAPITFINNGGQFIVKSSGSYGIKMENCKYFKFSGTGSGDKYGIKIDGGHISFTIDKLSTNFEINNLEVLNAGFAGIMAKTDPTCDEATWRGNFTMRELSFHDNYVHHVTGEGFYIGNSFYNGGKDLSCGKVYPHSIVNVKIYNNKVTNSGCEGIQVGCVIEGLKVYNNTVENFGESPFASYQNNGVQIGEGSGGLMYNNVIKNGPGNGIQMLGYGDNVVFNNLVVNAGAFGIFADERFTPGNGFKFLNNTIVNSGKDGIQLYSELVPMNIVCNNIIVSPRNGVFLGKKSGVKLTESHNYYHSDISSAKFVNSSAGNYQLAAGSPAIDKGMNASSFGVTFDLGNGARPTGVSHDIGAWEANSGGVIVDPNPEPEPPAPVTQTVSSFTLVNADTDKDIATLTEGYVIDFAAIGTSNVNIRANTSPSTVGSVQFALDANANFRTESGVPYTIAGDAGTDYNAWTPTVGTHKLVGTPFSGSAASGTKGTPKTINFTVKGTTTTPPTATQAVTSFTLVNADTDKDIATITEGYVIDFTAIGTSNVNVRANTNPATVGSVQFALDANANFRTESGAPYTIAGDAGTNYNAWTPAVGTHKLVGTPYTLANATGTKGTPLTVNFTVKSTTTTPPPVVTQAVTSFTLVNADTDRDIATLTNGYVINYTLLGTKNISIRANTNPATVGSVQLGLDGNSNFRTESGAPYTINGDAGTDYFAWTPTIGSHTVTGTPYTLANAAGTKGTPLSITFSVTSGTTTTPTDPLPAPSTSLKLYPTLNAYLDGGRAYSESILRVDGVKRITYVKYTVTGLGTSKPTTAKIRLKVEGDNGYGTVKVGAGSHNNWTVSNLYNTKPAISYSLSSLKSSYEIGKIYEFNVAPAITGDGTYTFVITMESGANDVSFSSSTGSFKPELLITK